MPACASASASTGPFSPPPTISTSQSRPMPRTRVHRACTTGALSVAPPDCPARCARLGSGRTRGTDVAELAFDDGGRPRRRDRHRADRPACARRGLSRHHSAPSRRSGDLPPHDARARPGRGGRRRGARPERDPPRPARRRADRLEGPLRHRWRRHRGRLGAARRPHARPRRRGARRRHPCRPRLPRQDPPLRARLLRPRHQPGDRHAAERARPGARPRRLLLRQRRRRRLPPGARGDRLGHRRLGAGPRRLERPRRAQDHTRPAVARRRAAAAPELRHRRPPDPHRRGRRAAPRRPRRSPSRPRGRRPARRPLPRARGPGDAADPRRAASRLRDRPRPPRRSWRRRRPRPGRRRRPDARALVDRRRRPRPTASGARRSRRAPS